MTSLHLRRQWSPALPSKGYSRAGRPPAVLVNPKWVLVRVKGVTYKFYAQTMDRTPMPDGGTEEDREYAREAALAYLARKA